MNDSEGVVSKFPDLTDAALDREIIRLEGKPLYDLTFAELTALKNLTEEHLARQQLKLREGLRLRDRVAPHAEGRENEPIVSILGEIRARELRESDADE